METAILSIIAGAIISYFIAKWQMKRNKIVHFSINSYDIGKGLSDEFPEFKLHFAGEALAKNVMVLKGGFMNTGRNDINGLKGENDIKMILPEECKLRSVKVKPSTEDLIVNTSNSGKNVINFGINEILKPNEYFKYTAIIETSKDINKITEKTSFQHRILNTDKIKDVHIGECTKLRRDIFVRAIRVLYILVFIFSLSVISLFIFYPRMQFEILNNATHAEVQMYVGTKSQIYVTEGEGPAPFVYCKIIDKHDLEKDYTIVPKTNYGVYIPDVIIGVGFMLILLPMVISSYYNLFLSKNKHIANVIKVNEKLLEKKQCDE